MPYWRVFLPFTSRATRTLLPKVFSDFDKVTGKDGCRSHCWIEKREDVEIPTVHMIELAPDGLPPELWAEHSTEKAKQLQEKMKFHTGEKPKVEVFYVHKNNVGHQGNLMSDIIAGKIEGVLPFFKLGRSPNIAGIGMLADMSVENVTSIVNDIFSKHGKDPLELLFFSQSKTGENYLDLSYRRETFREINTDELKGVFKNRGINLDVKSFEEKNLLVGGRFLCDLALSKAAL